MASEGFRRASRAWLGARLGGDHVCPNCGSDDWDVSEPDYPLVRFVCRQCGHGITADTAVVAAHPYE